LFHIILSKYFQAVKLTIEYFDVEYNAACIWDWLKIYDVSSGEPILIEYLCGFADFDLIFYSYGNRMMLEFHSDYIVTEDGFKAKFEAVDVWSTACDSAPAGLIAFAGLISSPYYPESYTIPGNPCEWHYDSEGMVWLIYT